MTEHFRKRAKIFLGLLISLLALTLTLEGFDTDLRVSGLFFERGKGWPLAERQPWLWLFEYGTLPGLLFSLGSFGLWLASLGMEKLALYRRPLLIVWLTALIGAGLIVHLVFKDYWGRPRPRETVQLGGTWEYHAFYEPGTPGRGKAFPCGHCTTGYLFLASFAFWAVNRRLALFGMGLGVLYGILISSARIVQGGHYLNDSLWAMGMTLLTALALDALLPTERLAWAKLSDRQKAISLLGLTLLVLMLLGMMLRRPYYKSYRYPQKIFLNDKRLILHTNSKDMVLKEVIFEPRTNLEILLDVEGVGWTNCFHYFYALPGPKKSYHLETFQEGNYIEIKEELTLLLPSALKGRIQILLDPEPTLPPLSGPKPIGPDPTGPEPIAPETTESNPTKTELQPLGESKVTDPDSTSP